VHMYFEHAREQNNIQTDTTKLGKYKNDESTCYLGSGPGSADDNQHSSRKIQEMHAAQKQHCSGESINAPTSVELMGLTLAWIVSLSRFVNAVDDSHQRDGHISVEASLPYLAVRQCGRPAH
jgi:hypothetical protein